MILGSLFRSKKAKQFSFTPRYYDEDKEIMENRKAQIAAELKGNPSLTHDSPISLRDKWQRNRKSPSILEKKSNIRLAAIISMLSAFCYWFLS